VLGKKSCPSNGDPSSRPFDRHLERYRFGDEANVGVVRP
jgi:hypothetical protein